MNPFVFVAGLALIVLVGFGLYVGVMFVGAFLGLGYSSPPKALPPPPRQPLPLTEREDPDAPPYTYEAVAAWLPARIRADIETAVNTTDRKART